MRAPGSSASAKFRSLGGRHGFDGATAEISGQEQNRALVALAVSCADPQPAKPQAPSCNGAVSDAGAHHPSRDARGGSELAAKLAAPLRSAFAPAEDPSSELAAAKLAAPTSVRARASTTRFLDGP